MKKLKFVCKRYRVLHIPTGEFFEYDVECLSKQVLTLKHIHTFGCSRIVECEFNCNECIWYTSKRIEFDVVRLK